MRPEFFIPYTVALVLIVLDILGMLNYAMHVIAFSVAVAILLGGVMGWLVSIIVPSK